MNELVITGAFVYDHDGFERALELLADPSFPTDLLIEADDVPLDGILEAIQRLGSGELAAKVMIVPIDGSLRRIGDTSIRLLRSLPDGSLRRIGILDSLRS